ncbi:MAG: DUF2807 domain-containing protein [Bacteroidales bacterium]|nr:DUF2807 domain-containing protein [Bacteroidales bacterium]
MKTFVYKVLFASTLIIASANFGFSQTRTVEHDFPAFDGIEASDGFKVSISKSDTFGAKLTIDDALESYVQCYVRSSVLHIGLDDKNIPKDVKKQYKSRNSQGPTLVAVVYLPTLNSLYLNDDCEFYSANSLNSGNFVLDMKGSSSVNNIKILATSFSLSIDKNARFTNAGVTTENDMSVISDGKATVSMEFACKNLNVSGSGSADLTLNGTAEDKVTVTANASSKFLLSGKAVSLDLSGKGTSAKVDASALLVDSAVVSITGIAADISPEKALELDLGKGSEVDYAGDPAVKIVKIQNASVTRK